MRDDWHAYGGCPEQIWGEHDSLIRAAVSNEMHEQVGHPEWKVEPTDLLVSGGSPSVLHAKQRAGSNLRPALDCLEASYNKFAHLGRTGLENAGPRVVINCCRGQDFDVVAATGKSKGHFTHDGLGSAHDVGSEARGYESEPQGQIRPCRDARRLVQRRARPPTSVRRS
jgi:hypothetical protein